jgi:hypothetical protein
MFGCATVERPFFINLPIENKISVTDEWVKTNEQQEGSRYLFSFVNRSKRILAFVLFKKWDKPIEKIPDGFLSGALAAEKIKGWQIQNSEEIIFAGKQCKKYFKIKHEAGDIFYVTSIIIPEQNNIVDIELSSKNENNVESVVSIKAAEKLYFAMVH